MLSVRDLTVKYGTVTAVDRVTLDVSDGEVLVLLGPSGCGKSTLLRAIAGLEPIVSGGIEWDGADLARVPVHRRGFGLMFQDGVLFPHRTVAGNVAYGLRGTGTSQEIAARVEELLELVGLAGYQSRRVTTLSGGEAQRVALARALAPSPRLLLLDEPLAALDRGLRDQLLADLRTIFTRTGTTAIFVTHDQTEAFAIADRLAVMREGAVVQHGEPGELWSHPATGWVARFLGYTTVVDAHLLDGASPSAAGRLALRPSALVVDDAGSIAAEVLGVVPGPTEQQVRVRICEDGLAGYDAVRAIARPHEAVAVGSQVRLRFDPDGAVPVGRP